MTQPHLLPTSCYICGNTERHAPTPTHNFWSNAEDALSSEVYAKEYQFPTYDAAAAFVDEWIGR